MWLVAIAAGDAGCKHLTLLERAVIIDFVKHLSVGVIEAAGEHRNSVSVRQRLPRNPVFRKLPASRMAQPAGLILPTCFLRAGTALRIAGLRIGTPSHSVSLVQEGNKPLQRVIILYQRPRVPLTTRPANVPRTFTVASLAADAD